MADSASLSRGGPAHGAISIAPGELLGMITEGGGSVKHVADEEQEEEADREATDTPAIATPSATSSSGTEEITTPSAQSTVTSDSPDDSGESPSILLVIHCVGESHR